LLERFGQPRVRGCAKPSNPGSTVNNFLYKLAWSACTAGPLETLKGIGRLVRGDNYVKVKEGWTLSYLRKQRPTLLVVAGQYVDPEFAFFASKKPIGWKVVDVGAGIGQFAIYLAKAGADVIAYEPNKSNRHMLEFNRDINKVAIQIREEPVGAYYGKDVFMPDDGLMAKTQINDGLGTAEGVEMLKQTTLDAEYPTAEIDLVKINVAGYEWEVLHGMTKLLMEKRVRYLCVLDGIKMRTKILEIDTYGYQWFTMSHDGRIWTIPRNGPVVKPPFCRHLLAVRRDGAMEMMNAYAPKSSPDGMIR
jgi:FkbM family methyltransferase